MGSRALTRALGGLAACCAIAAGGAAAAAAAAPASPLPGFPRFRGVELVRDGSAATASRERAVASALKAASANTSPDCRSFSTNPGADLCYWGGPVVRAHKVHLIFWEGTTGQKHPFGAGYVETIETYFEKVAAASGSLTNVYAVPTQYGDEKGPGEYAVSFAGPTVDVYEDKAVPLPPAGKATGECEDPATGGTPPNGVCVTDKELHTQIEAARAFENVLGHKWESSQSDVYFVFTPAEVGGCFFGAGEGGGEANACALAPGGYCAYHSSFENTAKEGVPPIYADMPDNGGVLGCDSFEHPHGSGAEGADATLDSTSHEHNEIITDPFGTSWLDVIGQEVGDKCLPPETFDIYGTALGGTPATLVNETEINPGTLYNQEIGGQHYYLQTEWSNQASSSEGRCVQRALEVGATMPAEAKATVPATFSGAASGEPADPIAYWIWNFGDGMQAGTPEATVSHTYAHQGTYEVTLTVIDALGNSQTRKGLVVQVGVAPPPPPTSSTKPASEIITRTVTVVEPAPSLAYLNLAQLASKLGLPGSGAVLSGTGVITLGHAECPPACGVTASLYAKVTTTRHHRRIVRQVLIGAAQLRIAVKGTGTIAVTLNAAGRRLLRAKHRLAAQLKLSVEDQQGASWQISRSLVLTAPGTPAKHRRRRR